MAHPPDELTAPLRLHRDKSAPNPLEAAARVLTDAGVRLLWPLPAYPRFYPARYSVAADGGKTKVGLVVDTETTGLNRDHAEIVEIGAQMFTYRDTGELLGASELFRFREQPKHPIPADATAVHGIRDEDVAGLSFDEPSIRSLFTDVTVVVCHNAAFDAPLLYRRFPWLEPMERPFVCSLADVDWRARGYETSKLGYLLQDHAGCYISAHDATADVGAVTHILATPFADGTTPLAELLARGLTSRARIVAAGAPFHAKDVLKGRGYRWNDPSDKTARFAHKAWWNETLWHEAEAEAEWVRREVGITPAVQRIEPHRRFRA